MKNKIFATLLALTLALSLTACGSKSDDSAKADTTDDAQTEQPAEPQETVTLNVAASPTPHAEILKQCVPILAEQGIDLQITEFDDYVMPNTAVEDGSLDANYFQHLPYLEDFNAKNGTHLASVGVIHYEPMGLYPGKSSDLANIPDGAKIGIPGDNTNGARALLLLEAQGVLKLKEGVGLEATELDIEENPHNVEIVPMEAANLPASLPDLDFAVINGNYASGAGIGDTVLVTEDADSVAAQTYGNIVAVKEGNENNPAVLALVEALKSDAIKQYIKDTYNGIVMPME